MDAVQLAESIKSVTVSYSESRALPDKLVQLASLVRERGLSWALLVPTDPADAEWVIRLGSVEVVAEELGIVLDLAIEELEPAVDRNVASFRCPECVNRENEEPTDAATDAAVDHACRVGCCSDLDE